MEKIIKYGARFGIMLLMCLMLTGCSDDENIDGNHTDDESISSKQNIDGSIKEKNFERYDLLMTKYINDTKIYGVSVEKGIYDKLQVEIDGNTKVFDWTSLPDDNYLPVIEYADVTLDGENEIIITLTEDVTNDYITQKVHVLNPETLDEYELEDISSYIEDNLTYRQENDIVSIYINETEILKAVASDLKNPDNALLNIKYDSENLEYEINNSVISTDIKLELAMNNETNNNTNENAENTGNSENISESNVLVASDSDNTITNKITLKYVYSKEDEKFICEVE